MATASITWGLDRVDNSRGYQADNVVPCCADCNYMKGQMSQEAFLHAALAISERSAAAADGDGSDDGALPASGRVSGGTPSQPPAPPTAPNIICTSSAVHLQTDHLQTAPPLACALGMDADTARLIGVGVGHAIAAWQLASNQQRTA